MKKILVTGGAGFIGSNLCEYLLQQGHQVSCMDNFQSSSKKNIEYLLINSNFTLIKHDILQPIVLEEVFDEIFHLACPASPKQYQSNPIFTLDTNYIGTKNVLEFALLSRTKVLFTSTSEIYGDPQVHPQVETYWGNVNPIGVRSCYDEGKRIAETLMVEYSRKYNLPVKIARIFNSYGPKMEKDDGRVISNFINQAIYNKPITVYGDGTQTRSFCYVDDMVLGLVSLMDSAQSINTPINIGNPDEISIKEIALLIIYLTASNSKLEFKELPSDDPKLRKPDISKAKELLSWSPMIELQEGLRKTIEYFRGLE